MPDKVDNITPLSSNQVRGSLTHCLAQGSVTPNRHVEGSLASGASYLSDVPANWNGTAV